MSIQSDEEAVRLTTQPLVAQQPGTDLFGPLRFLWRQLTSMRTALLLLFLLALASVPGGFLPQRRINPIRVSQYLAHHQQLGPFLDRLQLFDVFSSVWFSAIYLLLFVSLIGCLFPRTRLHLRALTAKPPKVPRSVRKLPANDRWETTESADAVLAQAEKALRGWRVVRRGDELSAERGYLRETGNLVFHLSLVLLLIGIALGAFRGFKGTVLVVEGKGFSNTVASYDNLQPGTRFTPSSLVPFSLTLDAFNATYTPEGHALTFDAQVHWSKDGGASKPYDVRVNHPLHIGGAKTYLIGHGYAPHIVFRDSSGAVVDDRSVPCLPQDTFFRSTCVIKEPNTSGTQYGFSGVFTPSTQLSRFGEPISSFPGLRNPQLTLLGFQGDLGVDGGAPQSVYDLNTTAMKPLDAGRRNALLPGQVWHLEGGASLAYVGTDEWATFQVTQDPGKLLALAASVGMVGGLLLSLFIRRRRLWVRVGRVGTDPGAPTTVEVGGLARTDPDRYADEFAGLVKRMRGIE
ncbi:MAG: ResB family protein [Frankiales bacterium]|nr:ResB family protein [Frankiales bacterium]